MGGEYLRDVQRPYHYLIDKERSYKKYVEAGLISYVIDTVMEDCSDESSSDEDEIFPMWDLVHSFLLKPRRAPQLRRLVEKDRRWGPFGPPRYDFDFLS